MGPPHRHHQPQRPHRLAFKVRWKEETRERGGDLGSITLDALGTEVEQGEKLETPMVVTMPMGMIDLLMRDRGALLTSNTFRDISLLCEPSLGRPWLNC